MKQEILQQFGERVKTIRTELKLTQKEFATKIDVASSYISELESGKMGAGFDFLYKLSLHYNINPFFLFHGRGPKFLSTESELEITQTIPTILKDTEIKKLLKWMDNSDLLKFEVLTFYKRYLIENGAMLKQESIIQKKEDPYS